MKIEINTRTEALNLAAKLRKCCTTCASVTLPYGQSLEVVSSLFGHANWDTMSAALKKTLEAPRLPANQGLGVVSMTMYWQLRANSSEPSGWAKVAVTEAWLINAASLFAKPAGHSMTVPAGVVGWNIDDDWNRCPMIISEAKLGVLKTGELEICVPSTVNDTMLTSVPLSVEALQKLVVDAKAESRTNLYHAVDMEELRYQLEESCEMCFCRECDIDYPDGGDGYDGMCPDCADKAHGGENDNDEAE